MIECMICGVIVCIYLLSKSFVGMPKMIIREMTDLFGER